MGLRFRTSLTTNFLALALCCSSALGATTTPEYYGQTSDATLKNALKAKPAPEKKGNSKTKPTDAATLSVKGSAVVRFKPQLQGPWGTFRAGNGAASGFGPLFFFSTNRWVEDWSYLRDHPSNDPLMKLKYIPLNSSGTSYISFNASYLYHGWFNQKAGLGTTKRSPSYRSGNRISFGADVHLSPYFRMYGEFIDAMSGGVNYYGYAGGAFRSNLNVNQAFVELRKYTDTTKVGVMAGRFVFEDFPASVSASRPFYPMYLTWNGVRGYLFRPNFRLDFFDLALTDTVSRHAFNHPIDWGTRLYGAYSSVSVLPMLGINVPNATLFADTFFYGYVLHGGLANIASQTGTVAATTRRDNIGERIWGRIQNYEFNLLGLWQGGVVRRTKTGVNSPVSAYMIDANILYHFAHTRFAPSVGMQFNMASGANLKQGGSGVWSNYLSPFVPSPYVMDLSQEIGPSNIILVGPVANFNPYRTVLLNFRAPVVWRANSSDTLYSLGSAIIPLHHVRGSYSGFLPQVSMTWNATHRLAVRLDGEYLLVSPELHAAGARSEAFFQTVLNYNF